MSELKIYGLVGKTLSHSFSKGFFENKFKRLNLSDYSYQNFELENIDALKLIIKEKNISGLNVTIPYKEAVIPLLNELDEHAQQIGAVNCITISSNYKLKGYNTDWIGFKNSIKPFLKSNHQKALILGTGGSSKAVAYVLTQLGIDYYFVSSNETKKTNNTFFYSELNDYVIRHFQLIINTTPVGMWPTENECPTLPYEFITSEHFCVDLIYNPEQTLFLKKATKQQALTLNGLSMLQHQAEESWKLWQKHSA